MLRLFATAMGMTLCEAVEVSHNLATSNGRTTMVYTGEVSWHRLGTKLDQPATAREAIEAAGLNYSSN